MNSSQLRWLTQCVVTKQTKMSHGGKRKGAGRPKKEGYKRYTHLLEIRYMDLLPRQKSEYVQSAIREKLIRDGLIVLESGEDQDSSEKP